MSQTSSVNTYPFNNTNYFSININNSAWSRSYCLFTPKTVPVALVMWSLKATLPVGEDMIFPARAMLEEGWIFYSLPLTQAGQLECFDSRWPLCNWAAKKSILPEPQNYRRVRLCSLSFWWEWMNRGWVNTPWTAGVPSQNSRPESSYMEHNSREFLHGTQPQRVPSRNTTLESSFIEHSNREECWRFRMAFSPCVLKCSRRWH